MSASDKALISHWIDHKPWTRSNQVLKLNARGMSGEDWYTNPHGNETPGRHFATLLQAKHDDGEYHPPAICVYLREPRGEGEERKREDKWTEMDIGRRIAGCLTDLEIIARMDLVRVRVSLAARENVGDQVVTEMMSSRNKGVQNDLRVILSKLRPVESSLDAGDGDQIPRTEYEEIKAIADTVDIFLPISLKSHGISS